MRLEAEVKRLLAQLEHAPDGALYRELQGEWSPMKVLAHVAEMVPYWSRQAEAVATREREGESFGRTAEDPARLAAVEDHAREPLSDAMARLRVGLAEATQTLRRIPDAGWRRTGRHPRRGEMTVERIVDELLLDHLDEHVRQLDAALGGASR